MSRRPVDTAASLSGVLSALLIGSLLVYCLSRTSGLGFLTFGSTELMIAWKTSEESIGNRI